MFDNFCKYLAKTLSTILAWLLGSTLFNWGKPAIDSPSLPLLVVLTYSQDATERLREVAVSLDIIEDRSLKANVTTAIAIFGGLLVKSELIKTILRSDMMRESAFYQEILQEGEQRGLLKSQQEGEQEDLLKGKLEVARNLLERGLSLSDIYI